MSYRFYLVFLLLPQLQKLGVKSILSLREYHTDRALEIGGFSCYSLRLDAKTVTREELLKALEIIRKAPKPVLVHCWHGSDRTGVVIAAYRIYVQHWAVPAAIDEFVNGNYGYHVKMFPNLKVLLESLEKK